MRFDEYDLDDYLDPPLIVHELYYIESHMAKKKRKPRY